MRCKLCGKSTNKILCTYHDECKQKLEAELSDMDLIYENYQNGVYSWKTAKSKFIDTASSGYVNKFFSNNVANKNDIDTHDRIVYSYSGAEILEEKNRCKMKRTGLSYARYPQWQPATYKISDFATVVLTDKGLYLLGICTLKFPYSKIINCGIDNFLGTASFYFDVKTSSPHRHRYKIKIVDKRQAFKITEHIYQVLELMLGNKER